MIAIIVASNGDHNETIAFHDWLCKNSADLEARQVFFIIKARDHDQEHYKMFLDIKCCLYLSYPDTGIYNAWNQALAEATKFATCVMFLGLSDRLNFTLIDAKVFEDLSHDVLIYDFISMKNGRQSYKTVSGKLLKKFPMRPAICFSSSVFRLSIFETRGFNDSFKILGDFQWIVDHHNGLSCYKINEPLVCFETGGVSNNKEYLEQRMNEYSSIVSSLNYSSVHATVLRYIAKFKSLISI